MPSPRTRRAQLLAALAFLRYPPRAPALAALHAWLDNWSGIGLIVVGMERHGYRFSLRKYGNGDGAWWRSSTATWHLSGRVRHRFDAVEGDAAGGVERGEEGGVRRAIR